jgi:hypothetical protein
LSQRGARQQQRGGNDHGKAAMQHRRRSHV